MNFSFYTIDNNDFREVLLILKSELTFVYRIKFVNILLKNYEIVRNQIKENLKDLRRMHLILNA